MTTPNSTATSATHDAPYRGLRVLDLGQGVASPYCAMLMALNGADVVKVEPPTGDWARRLGTAYGEHSALSAVYNRGKRGVCLDIKHQQGRRVARELALRADVLIEGFRPGVAASLGLGYDDLKQDNSGLLYVSISGFGQVGPYAERACTDSVAQAYSGIVSLNRGADGVPNRVGALISDVSTGLYAYQALATALYARSATGLGRLIDVSLTQSTAALLGHKLAEHVLEGGQPRALNAPAGSYQTSDGWLVLTLVTEQQYQQVCTTLGCTELIDDPRFNSFPRRADNSVELIKRLQQIFSTADTAWWLERLKADGVLVERVLEPRDWLNDPHVIATRSVVSVPTEEMGTVYVPRTPGSSEVSDVNLGPSPTRGQHNEQVLAEIGINGDAFDDLVAARVIHAATGR